MKTVLITGASGYIGGQTAIYFHDNNWRVIGIDERHPPEHLSKGGYFSKFLISPFNSEESLHLIQTSKPDAIVHCAGTSLVGPSKTNPSVYYQNNFVATKTLVDFLVEQDIKTRFIFSSSASTYGEPIMPPCREEDPPLPLSPYGESKLMTEMMLNAYIFAYGIDAVIFRYFNVCGADSKGRHGQRPGSTHIFAKVLEAVRDGNEFTLLGTNLPTQDGTCIRDYVHVEDIAKAHFLAANGASSGVYNLSTSTGYSNKQIIDTVFKVLDKTTTIVEAPARAGDPAVLTGSAEKFYNETGWQPSFTLEEIVKTVWQWYNR